MLLAASYSNGLGCGIRMFTSAGKPHRDNGDVREKYCTQHDGGLAKKLVKFQC